MNQEYVIDFVIPHGKEGPTGPTGPQGKQGPTGPTTLESVIFTQYYNSNSSGLLTIFKAILLPDNNTIYSTSNNEITINEPGNYEYTLCGKINGKASIQLQATDESGTSRNLISIDSQIERMLFSKTKILQTNSKQRIRILFYANDSSANAEPLKFLIKRLPF